MVALLGGCDVSDIIIPSLEDTLEVKAVLPDTIEVGKSVSCAVEVLKNTGNHKLVFSWTINGSAFFCGESTRTFMVQGVSPPEEFVPGPGTYTVTLTARAEDDQSVSDTDSKTLVVKRKPSWITYTGVTSTTRDFFRVSIDAEKKVEQLTDDGDKNKYWLETSPTGTRFAFVRSRMPCNGILVVRNRDGSDEVEIGDGLTWAECGLKGARSPRWSPDGKSIAVVGGDETNRGGFRISVVTVATREIRHLDLRTCDDQPAPCIDEVALEVVWSPDGKSVYTTLWEDLEGGGGRTHIVRVDAVLAVKILYTDGISNSPDFLGPSVYDVSKDGGTLSLHVRYSNDRNPRLALLPTDGSGNLRFITPAESDNPGWPTFCSGENDSEWVYYVDKARPNELRRVRPDGTGDETFFTASRNIETPRCQRPPS